ncbi:MAG: DUF2490 domain-containing protein [Saprospiraceae bacterium]|nr:DUF2490 domain-containing protein [Saprospiraceae bacterium]
MQKQHSNTWSLRIIPVLLTLSSLLHGQKTTITDEQLWVGAFNQTRISNKWGFWFDAHLRLKDQYVQDLSQAIIRFGPTFYVTDDVRLTAAYAYVHTYPAPGHANISLPEHRPWQQVQWFQRGKKARLTQAIRLEERYRRRTLNDDQLGEGYQFNWRIRYNFSLFLPLTKKQFDPGALLFNVNNEVFINFGKQIVYNHFDQNRLFLGLVYQVNKHAQLHGGYMNLYQQLAAGNTFRNQHSIRIFYFHNVDLRE